MAWYAHEVSMYLRRCTQAIGYNVGLGACGYLDNGNDFVAVVSPADWDNRAHCNKARSTPFFTESGSSPDIVTPQRVAQKTEITDWTTKKVMTAAALSYPRAALPTGIKGGYLVAFDLRLSSQRV
jgi:hypothetical protein